MKPWVTEETRARTRSNIVVVFVAVLLIASMYYFGTIWGWITNIFDTVMPFLIGFGIAFLLLPIVNRMEDFNNRVFFKKKRHPRSESRQQASAKQNAATERENALLRPVPLPLQGNLR